MGTVTSIILIAVVVGGGFYCIFEFGILDSSILEPGHSHDGLSNDSLAIASWNWNYRDLERNFDSNNGRVIFVQGTVGSVWSDFHMIGLWEESGTETKPDNLYLTFANNSECTNIFVSAKMKYDCASILKDDKVSGYVETAGLVSVDDGTSFPKAIIIKLHCSTC